MLQRISTRWALAVLVCVAVPFTAFALWVDRDVSTRLAEDSVRFHLLSTAADLADQLDEELAERWHDLDYLATVPQLTWHVSGSELDRVGFEGTVQDLFDRLVGLFGVYELVFSVDASGTVAMTDRGVREEEASSRLRRALMGQDLSSAAWFQEAMASGRADLGFGTVQDLLGVEGQSPYLIGMAVRLAPPVETEEPAGVLVALLRMDRFQRRIESFGVRRLGADDQEPQVDLYSTSYAWIWGADGDTILAHPTSGLVGTRVTSLEEGQLRPLVDAAREAPWGMYPDYQFRGIQKKAAFKRMEGAPWTVGIGADFSDIYAPVAEVSRTLLLATLIGLVSAVLLSVLVARRLVQPILDLEQHTRRLAEGHLDARLDWSRRDEFGDLARGFDRMAGDLSASRAQAMTAQKEAAWREMARQVAHEIKNPLTPISLSIGLLRRARAENSPEAETILERTMDLTERQVAAMRDIASDFHSFAGHHKEQVPVDVGEVLDEVLTLHAAWAQELGVTIHRKGTTGTVLADRGELHRALVNLVSNALEASEEGGTLEASCQVLGDEVELTLLDSGRGLEAEQAQHLFEPYFTTRSSGTGLGLAIVRRVVEDLGGRVTLENRGDRRGALARVVLPRYVARA